MLPVELALRGGWGERVPLAEQRVIDARHAVSNSLGNIAKEIPETIDLGTLNFENLRTTLEQGIAALDAIPNTDTFYYPPREVKANHSLAIYDPSHQKNIKTNIESALSALNANNEPKIKKELTELRKILLLKKRATAR